jgi:alkylation response protein AidB-like acyl-CoA dehydrogenase
VSFPVGWGGLALPTALADVVQEELDSAGAPKPAAGSIITYGMAGPTVLEHGTDEQRAKHLRRLFTGEDLWCQLFSEPGAGSDLAALSARAVRDGEDWVVNGQKVWTTMAHVARYGMLVVRTDPDAPKHRGLSYFILDMEAPGVEVRPLFQMTGEAEFNEVYLTDVRIPDSARLGEPGQGWQVALTTLMNERVAIGGLTAPRGSGVVARFMELWREKRETTDVSLQDVMRVWVDAEVLRLNNLRAAEMRAAGTPGPEGAIGKIVIANLMQGCSETALALLGDEGMEKPGGYPMTRPDVLRQAEGIGEETWQFLLLRSRAMSIEGGTTEIGKNILGERVLGLPGEPRTDKNRPWSESRRA